MTNAVRESGFFPCVAEDRFETDDDLIAGMLANDPAAWREFQNRYDRLIIRCITMTSRKSGTSSRERSRSAGASAPRER